MFCLRICTVKHLRVFTVYPNKILFSTGTVESILKTKMRIQFRNTGITAQIVLLYLKNFLFPFYSYSVLITAQIVDFL
jgi:hypothetical protein